MQPCPEREASSSSSSDSPAPCPTAEAQGDHSDRTWPSSLQFWLQCPQWHPLSTSAASDSHSACMHPLVPALCWLGCLCPLKRLEHKTKQKQIDLWPIYCLPASPLTPHTPTNSQSAEPLTASSRFPCPLNSSNGFPGPLAPMRLALAVSPHHSLSSSKYFKTTKPCVQNLRSSLQCPAPSHLSSLSSLSSEKLVTLNQDPVCRLHSACLMFCLWLETALGPAVHSPTPMLAQCLAHTRCYWNMPFPFVVPSLEE